MRRNRMRKLRLVWIVFLITGTTLIAHENSIFDNDDFSDFHCNDKTYKFKDNYIVIFDKDFHREEIIITDKNELIINDRHVKIDGKSKKILRKYYNELCYIREEAIDIGLEGAKIGLSGAKLGVKAVLSLPLLLIDGEDKYEEKIERASEKIEERGEELEYLGEKLGERTDDLEDLEDKLQDRVEELDDIYWF